MKCSETTRRMTLARKREAEAITLRLAGYTYLEVARALGLSNKTAARKAYLRGLERLGPIERREEARRLEAARLDRLQVPFWAKALAGDLEATQTVLNIMARRARLLGLDETRLDMAFSLLGTALKQLQAMPQEDMLRALGYTPSGYPPALNEGEPDAP